MNIKWYFFNINKLLHLILHYYIFLMYIYMYVYKDNWILIHRDYNNIDINNDREINYNEKIIDIIIIANVILSFLETLMLLHKLLLNLFFSIYFYSCTHVREIRTNVDLKIRAAWIRNMSKYKTCYFKLNQRKYYWLKQWYKISDTLI